MSTLTSKEHSSYCGLGTADALKAGPAEVLLNAGSAPARGQK